MWHLSVSLLFNHFCHATKYPIHFKCIVNSRLVAKISVITNSKHLKKHLFLQKHFSLFFQISYRLRLNKLILKFQIRYPERQNRRVIFVDTIDEIVSCPEGENELNITEGCWDHQCYSYNYWQCRASFHLLDPPLCETYYYP